MPGFVGIGNQNKQIQIAVFLVVTPGARTKDPNLIPAHPLKDFLSDLSVFKSGIHSFNKISAA